MMSRSVPSPNSTASELAVPSDRGRLLGEDIVAERIVVGDQRFDRGCDAVGVGLDADIDGGAAGGGLQQAEGDAAQHVGDVVGVAAQADAVEGEDRGLGGLHHVGEVARAVGDAELVHDVGARHAAGHDLRVVGGGGEQQLEAGAGHLDDRGLDPGGRGLGVDRIGDIAAATWCW